MAVFAPRANATLFRYYDMEGGPDTPPYPVNLNSHASAVEIGPATTLFLDNGTPGVGYAAANTSQEPGIPLNVPGGAAPNLTSIGFHRSGLTNLGVEIPMPSSQGIYDLTSVSFAYFNSGNGFIFGQLQMSTDGGSSFPTNVGGVHALPATPGSIVDFPVPAGTTLNKNNLVLRLLFTQGQSPNSDLQFELDNVQIDGTIAPLVPISIVSRKVHGGSGIFDTNLPLTPPTGVECRSGGATNDYSVVFTFPDAVTFSSAFFSGTGSISSTSGSGTTTITVNLTGVTNAQTIGITLLSVNNGTTTSDVSIPMGVLLGDTNGNGSVSASDIGQTKTQSGQPANGSNFRTDVNVNGSITAADIGLVKSKSGTSLPP